jgi:uncharacterized protein (TIGR00369 family)
MRRLTGLLKTEGGSDNETRRRSDGKMAGHGRGPCNTGDFVDCNDISGDDLTKEDPITMNVETHHKTNASLCGKPVKLGEGYSLVSLRTTEEMGVDDFGLVHGGFIFGLADYAAMIAVNHPNVALGAADVKFLKPVRVGETLMAEARVERQEGKKVSVAVRVERNDKNVFEGTFVCFVLKNHVLDK